MRYRNVAVARPNPAHAARGENKELLRLLSTVAAIILLALFAIDRITVWLAPRLPFSAEQRLAHTLRLDVLPVKLMSVGQRPADPAIEATLQNHADRIARALQLPPGMTIKVHYVDNSTVNAVATLGGQITVFRGLLEKLRYDEELDGVLAHEIGHVLHRHMVQHLSRGIMSAIAINAIGIRNSTLNQWLIGDAEQLQQLAYSRDAEREADGEAVRASQQLYGHAQGVVSVFELFERLQQAQGASAQLPWLASHPQPQERAATARATGTTATPLTPLAAPLVVGAAASKPSPAP